MKKIQITRKDINEMVYASVKKLLREFDQGSPFDVLSTMPGGPDEPEYEPEEEERDTDADFVEKIPNTVEMLKDFVENNYPDVNFDELYKKIRWGNYDKISYRGSWDGDKIAVRVFGEEEFDWEWDDSVDFDCINHYGFKGDRRCPEAKAFYAFISKLERYISGKVSELNQMDYDEAYDLLDSGNYFSNIDEQEILSESSVRKSLGKTAKRINCSINKFTERKRPLQEDIAQNSIANTKPYATYGCNDVLKMSDDFDGEHFLNGVKELKLILEPLFTEGKIPRNKYSFYDQTKGIAAVIGEALNPIKLFRQEIANGENTHKVYASNYNNQQAQQMAEGKSATIMPEYQVKLDNTPESYLSLKNIYDLASEVCERGKNGEILVDEIYRLEPYLMYFSQPINVSKLIMLDFSGQIANEKYKQTR